MIGSCATLVPLSLTEPLEQANKRDARNTAVESGAIGELIEIYLDIGGFLPQQLIIAND